MVRQIISMTNIEQEMCSILDEMQIQYATFFPVRLTSLELDFALPQYKLNIEADGSYWHNKRKTRDRRRDYYLKKLGWKTIRFTDKEIFEKRDEIKQKISEEIQNARNKNQCEN
jgi:very-short-patch-repair endonuclease